MKTWINITIALRALRGNPLRSILTMLGIIIGVAAVITMVAIGTGAQMQIAERIRSLGANLIIVTPGSQSSKGVRYAAGTRHTLTEGDSAAIAREIPEVRVTAPAIYGTAQVIHGNHNWSTSVVGGVPDHLVARDWRIESGGSFSLAEVSGAAKVALLGSTVAEKLFEDDDPVGRQIRIREVPFTVIGLLGSKGSDGGGRDQDDIIIIPLSTAKMRVLGGSHEVNRQAVGYINVKVSHAGAMGAAERQIKRLRRHTPPSPSPKHPDLQNVPSSSLLPRSPRSGRPRFYDHT